MKGFPWVRVEVDLMTSRKFYALAKSMGDTNQALASLVRLFTYTATHAPDGNVTKALQNLDYITGVNRTPVTLERSFYDSGWFEDVEGDDGASGVFISGWYDMYKDIIDKRNRDRERKKVSRGLRVDSAQQVVESTTHKSKSKSKSNIKSKYVVDSLQESTTHDRSGIQKVFQHWKAVVRSDSSNRTKLTPSRKRRIELALKHHTVDDLIRACDNLAKHGHFQMGRDDKSEGKTYNDLTSPWFSKLEKLEDWVNLDAPATQHQPAIEFLN